MKVYTVHERDAAAALQETGTTGPGLGPTPADRIDRAEQLVFVGDGFSWLAFDLPPAMLIAHNLWFGLAIYTGAFAAIIALFWSAGAAPAWIGLAIVALHLIFGFEFSELRRSSLDAKGWANLGTITGQNRDDCERRFLESWLPRQPLISRQEGDTVAPSTRTILQPQSTSPVSKRGFGLPWSKR